MKNILRLIIFTLSFSLGYAQLSLNNTPVQQKNWRLGFTGGISFGNNEYFSTSISSALGYYLGQGIEAGMTAGFQHSGNKLYNYNLFSGGPYANYSFIPQMFARVHYEYYTGTQKNKVFNYKSNINESALWVGGGYQSNGRVGIRAGIMYNVLYKENSRIFSSALKPFAGIVFSL